MDFERARFNMVEQQIRPWDVLDPEVLDLLMATRREDFVSPQHRDLAFSDIEVPIVLDGKPTGETMLFPRVEGRILQALALKKHENVLLIGAGSGYLAALMAYRSRKVSAFEIHPGIAQLAARNLKDAGISNAQVIEGNGADRFAAGKTGEERFDAIVFSGSLSALPETLSACLNPGARVVAFVGEFPVVQALLLTAGAQGTLSSQVLFETALKPLRGFAKPSSFKF